MDRFYASLYPSKERRFGHRPLDVTDRDLDAINLGLTKMAKACPGAGGVQLVRAEPPPDREVVFDLLWSATAFEHERPVPVRRIRIAHLRPECPRC